MESTQLVIRKEESQFKDYEDLFISLGKGMHSEVIKVKSKNDGIEYAMKVTDADKMKNLQFAKQIIQECTLLNSLNHENIIKVKDFYEDKSGKFVSIMEYQDSYDLDKIINYPW